jgi:YegS/Rv2252/BmrU family lipid kinase
MTPKRVGFIVNPAAGAGRGRARWEEFSAGFNRSSIQEKVLFTSQPGEAVRLARELALECDVVVAVGGDGIVFEVASGILLSGAVNAHLGIVPLGTGNDTAILCGIGETAQARQAFGSGRTRALDVIRIRCVNRGTPVTYYALLYAGVGIIGEVLKQVTPRVKRLFGRRLAYPVGALRAIWKYDAPRMRVTCDGQMSENRYLLMCASNAELSGGGMRLAPGAKMDDGLLDVNLAERVSRLTAAALVWRMSRGHRISHPKLRYFTARAVAVEADPPIEVQADGEIIGHTPAQFEIVPKALRVLVP